MTTQTPAEHGRHLALLAPPISDAQAMEFARILLSDEGSVAA